MSNLYIPKKIKVGYQNREGTYTGKIAYVVYYDHEGKLRKEGSWNSWRDNEIEPEEFENTPTNGFVLNKEARRCNWSHFSSNRSYIRMYDPRGIEFEITPDNLIGVLMEANCNKRMLDCEFVYAWDGKDLVLLPCTSESYKEALEHTERQKQNIKLKELKKGCSYTLKNGNEIVYMGRFNWYRWNREGRTKTRQHVIWNGQTFERLTSPKKLAFLNNSNPVQDYASLMDKWQESPIGQEIKGWEIIAKKDKIEFYENRWKERKISNNLFYKICGNLIYKYEVEAPSRHWNDRRYQNRTDVDVRRHRAYYDIRTNSISYLNNIYYWDGTNSSKHSTLNSALESLNDCGDLYAILESGNKYKLDDFDSWRLPGDY